MTKHEAISAADDAKPSGVEHHEAIIIGSGMTGLYQLHKLLETGFDVITLERNADVGGTWFNNRYPGCRFDSESYTYGYSFNKELLDEWDWAEHFSPQPENLKYTNFVADKLNLRPHIRFNKSVEKAYFDEGNSIWRLTLADGEQLTCRYFIPALGALSYKTLPNFEGMDDFNGRWFHTFDWPHEGIDLKSKKVGVVGTGATGVQVIQTIASEVAELHVFQLQANWCAPLNNSPVSKEQMTKIRSRYDEIFETCLNTPGGFEHVPDRRGFHSMSREERLAFWDNLYDMSGFSVLLRNFVEIFTEEEANAEFSEYIADRIRRRVNDPETAEALIPKDHGFGVQRVPMETKYYEAYNRDNVHLVQLPKEPIERVVPEGIQTSQRVIDLDIIVFATGFDAGMGSYTAIDIRGIGGQQLNEKWKDGPATFYGMLANGFPNMIFPAGPQSGGAAINFPRAIEMCVEWTADLLTHVRDNGIVQFDVQPEAVEDWNREVIRARDKLLLRKATNWAAGINPNIEGRDKALERPLGYVGGNPKYRKMLDDTAANGYPVIDFIREESPVKQAG